MLDHYTTAPDVHSMLFFTGASRIIPDRRTSVKTWDTNFSLFRVSLKESSALILLCGYCCGAMGIMKMELKVGELLTNTCIYVGLFSGWRRQFNDSNYFFKWAAA